MTDFKGKTEYWSRGKKQRRLNSKATAKLNRSRTQFIYFGNDGGRLYLYIDGVIIDPKHFQDFTLETTRYSADYLNKRMNMSKLARIKEILFND